MNIVGGNEFSALDNEEKDFEQAVKRRQAVKLEDWPNEAGFEGLTEVRGPVNLKVSGSIPSWAAGTLYRTGPGEYNVENTPKGTFKTTHWFDGFAHTHRFEIIADPTDPERPIRVEYSSRYQARKLVDKIRQTGRVPGLTFAQRQDPCIGIFGKIMSVFKPLEPNPPPGLENICVTVQADMPGFTSNSNQKSSGHRGGRRTLFTTTDASLVQEINSDTLEPIGIARQRVLNPLLKGPLSSAHALRDPETGDLFNFNLDMGRHATYRVFRTNASTGTTDILATIRAPDVKPAYIHSFFMSSSFVILCIPSAHISYMGISVPWNGNIVDAIEPFNSSKLCKWFVVDRRGDRGVVATSETPAGFFFHSVNAFEEFDKSTGNIDVICDLIEYPSTEIIRAFEMDVLLGSSKGTDETFCGDEQQVRNCLQRLVRWKFQVPSNKSGKASRIKSEKVLEIKAPHAGELPTINPAYATRKHRYVYSMATHGYSTLQDTIVKTDVVTRQTISWQNPTGHTPGEAIFVPRPKKLRDGDQNMDTDEDEDEDDGVLLSVVLDGYGKTSYLVCLDAKTMKELGRAECDWAIGHGFHGLHIQADVPRL
ncbi:carotenoid cleavage dioxygenase 1 [Xylariaceae sp. AK1471]|nr:carotenoid cleavage dioxygenase 1 [Xylariaceae sp. AK1471]